MSCWVVPSIAADLWGVTLQNVLESVHTGAVPSKTDSGFTFVDVAPDSPVFKPGNKPRENPPTYTIVTREEITALTGEDDEEADSVLGDWRTARNDARNLRRAPKAA